MAKQLENTSEEIKNAGTIPITHLKPLQKGRIAFINGSQKVVQRLSDLGLTPMSEVTLIRKRLKCGPIEISIRRTTLAITRDIADNIFVKV